MLIRSHLEVGGVVHAAFCAVFLTVKWDEPRNACDCGAICPNCGDTDPQKKRPATRLSRFLGREGRSVVGHHCDVCGHEWPLSPRQG